MRIKLNASYIFNFQQFPKHYSRNNAAKLNKKMEQYNASGGRCCNAKVEFIWIIAIGLSVFPTERENLGGVLPY